jgi:hypothetical protein
MQANAERGEIEVELDGMAHVLRPSFAAQIEIERQTGKSIEQLASRAGDSALSLDDAAIVVTECVKAFGKATGNAAMQDYNYVRVGECIVEAGKLQVVKRLELLLYLAATGGYTAQGEVKTLTGSLPSGSAVTAA